MGAQVIILIMAAIISGQLIFLSSGDSTDRLTTSTAGIIIDAFADLKEEQKSIEDTHPASGRCADIFLLTFFMQRTR